MWAFVEFLAIIVIQILIRDVTLVSSVPSASTSPLWRGTYTQSSYWYSDYAVPKPKKEFVPIPQFCPETGRTVCTEVKPSYPTDDVFEVIRLAKAKRFNISSEFVDESQNDEEPNFYEEPKPQYDNRPKHEGYVVYQTAVHYDPYGNNNNNNNNNNPNQRIPYNANQNYGLYSPQNYGQQNLHYNYNGNRYPYDSTQKQRNSEPFVYSSHFTPSVLKGNEGNFQTVKGSFQQPFQNEMISQTQTRYKRQTGEVDPVCPSRVILIEPKAALNDKSQWKYVINLSERDSRLKQAIKVEVCQTPGQPCSNQVSLPFGFVSRCKQKYIKKKLLSLDSSGQSISSENFFAPSCCVCEIVRNNNKKK